MTTLIQQHRQDMYRQVHRLSTGFNDKFNFVSNLLWNNSLIIVYLKSYFFCVLFVPVYLKKFKSSGTFCKIKRSWERLNCKV